MLLLWPSCLSCLLISDIFLFLYIANIFATQKHHTRPHFFSFNAVQQLPLPARSSAVNVVYWEKLGVLSNAGFGLFVYSRPVNRFASCVGAERGARLIDSFLAGTQNQRELSIPHSRLNPVCNTLNCSLSDFTSPSLTLETMFSAFAAVFKMFVLWQAHQCPCDGDANLNCFGD